MKADDDEQPEARQEDVEEDAEEEEEEKWDEQKRDQQQVQELKSSRFTVQPILPLRDGDGLVEHGVLENVPLQKKSPNRTGLEPSLRTELGRLNASGPHAVVLIVQVDDESKRPPPHGLGRDEGVLEGGLPAGRNHGAELQSREVLDVELIILTGRKSPEMKGPTASGYQQDSAGLI